jgi:hypothetical protein
VVHGAKRKRDATSVCASRFTHLLRTRQPPNFTPRQHPSTRTHLHSHHILNLNQSLPRPSPPHDAQVLVDGNFLHAVAQMKLGHAKDVVVKFLGCPAKLFTTRCVQHELRGGACTKSKSS